MPHVVVSARLEAILLSRSSPDGRAWDLLRPFDQREDWAGPPCGGFLRPLPAEIEILYIYMYIYIYITCRTLQPTYIGIVEDINRPQKDWMRDIGVHDGACEKK